MKKILSMMLAVSLLVSLAGCASDKGDTSSAPESDADAAISTQAGSSTETGGADGSAATEEDVSGGSQTTAAHNNKPDSGKPGHTTAHVTTSKGGGSKPTAPKPDEPIKGDKAMYQNIFDSETAWLASLQLDNGALPMTKVVNGAATLNPYFSDFAALALLDKPDKYAGHVKKYMDWHFRHLNSAKEDYNGIDGTIYDYTAAVSNGKVTKETINESNGKKHYDSTDSYAATFLTVLDKYYRNTGDSGYILAHKNEIRRVINAMYATMHDGLTFAKPDYEVKYLMDNCEVYEGCVAAVNLLKKVIVPKDSSFKSTLTQCEQNTALVKNQIEKKMWNEKGQYYEPGLFRDGSAGFQFTWSEYYPCATAQTFPIQCGLIAPTSARAKQLYNHFCANYKWEDFKIPDSFFWGSNVLTAAKMGDTQRVNAYFTRYQKIMKRHAYPLYNADAAKVCMAAYYMLKKG